MSSKKDLQSDEQQRAQGRMVPQRVGNAGLLFGWGMRITPSDAFEQRSCHLWNMGTNCVSLDSRDRFQKPYSRSLTLVTTDCHCRPVVSFSW